jgi:hypothetical protein
MDDFAERAKALASYKTFSDAIQAGREILRRAGVVDPPPIPEFEKVFRNLTPEMRAELYAQLRNVETLAPAEAIRLWQPFIRRAFGQAKA